MYLLMLLATFISAIYGYNLSPRVDYERDFVRKKAMAMIYKFIYQEETIRSVLIFNILANEADFLLQPQGMIYAMTDDDGVVKLDKLYLKNKRTPVDYFSIEGRLPLGRRLYGDNEMMSKIICIEKGEDKKQLHENGAHDCTSGGGNNAYTDSCCDSSKSKRYMVTYKKIDARFINRVYGGVGMDFHRAIVKREYTDNIGVIHLVNGKWIFNGKIYFEPVYAEDKKTWEEDESHKDGNGRIKDFYPDYLKQRTTWELPDYFDREYFKNRQNKNICDDGCLFKIRSF